MDDDERAVRFYQLPGVTRAEVCERFGISRYRLDRARRAYRGRSFPTRPELVLGALTRNGQLDAGGIPDLAHLGSWLDYVNKDGSTADDVAALIDGLVADGWLAVDGERWRLLRPFP